MYQKGGERCTPYRYRSFYAILDRKVKNRKSAMEIYKDIEPEAKRSFCGDNGGIQHPTLRIKLPKGWHTKPAKERHKTENKLIHQIPLVKWKNEAEALQSPHSHGWTWKLLDIQETCYRYVMRVVFQTKTNTKMI